jgi:hypothetical protein
MAMLRIGVAMGAGGKAPVHQLQAMAAAAAEHGLRKATAHGDWPCCGLGLPWGRVVVRLCPNCRQKN